MSTETTEQRQFIKWFREEYPEYVNSLRCSMNGIKMRTRRWGSWLWNIMQSLGAQKHEADIALMLPMGKYHGLIVEHKGADMRHELSGAQQAYLDYHNEIGNLAMSTRGLEALKAAVKGYLEQ